MTQKLTTVIPAVLNRIRPGATFMAVMGYENNFGEVSDFGLVFHVSYKNAVHKALSVWESYQAKTRDEGRAKVALIYSYRDTIKGHNPRYKNANTYDRIIDGDGVDISGTKWYKNGKEVHLWGFRVHKKIITPGMYPVTNPDGLTLAKQKLMRMTPLHNYRQFKIVEDRFEEIGVDHLTLTHKDLLRELQ